MIDPVGQAVDQAYAAGYEDGQRDAAARLAAVEMSKTLIDERQPVREMVAQRLIIAAWGAGARLERAPALDRERFRNHAEALLVELEDAGWLVTAPAPADTTR